MATEPSQANTNRSKLNCPCQAATAVPTNTPIDEIASELTLDAWSHTFILSQNDTVCRMSASHTPTEPADRRPEPEALQHVSLGNLVIMSGAGTQRLTGKRCRKANGVMPEASPAQSTLKRLIAAEEHAREVLKAAEDHAQ